jgi:DNA-binding MarR family transcriptional regulator
MHDRLDAVEGSTNRLGIAQITDDDLCTALTQRLATLGIAHEDAHRRVVLQQTRHESTPDAAGGTSHKDGHARTIAPEGLIRQTVYPIKVIWLGMLGSVALATDQSRRATWRALYELVLDEHERHLAEVADLGITPGDLKALVRLVPGEPASMRTLASRCRCDASTATWLVDRLEKRGFVARGTHPTDRRVKVVMLTARGEQTRLELLDRLYEPPTAFDQLSRSDLAALRRIAGRLAATSESSGVLE